MKICIISGNPKKEGLCRTIADSVTEGIAGAGALYEEINLKESDLISCRVCGDGWGKCLDTHECEFGSDGFSEIKAKIAESDAIVIITPVYWGECSEVLKSLIDRFRRCEFRTGCLKDKQVLLIASAGGTGEGILSCLDQLSRFCINTGAVIFDFIGVNRWNSDYKSEAARSAAYALATGRNNKPNNHKG